MHGYGGDTVLWPGLQLCRLVVVIVSELGVFVVVVSPGGMGRGRGTRDIVEGEGGETLVCPALVVLGDGTVEIGGERGRFSAVGIVSKGQRQRVSGERWGV